MLEFPEHSGHLLGLCLELLGPFINYVLQIGGGGGFSQKLTQKKAQCDRAVLAKEDR